MMKHVLSKLQYAHHLSPPHSSPSQEPGFKRHAPHNQPEVSPLHQLHCHSTHFLSCLTINTNTCTTTYYCHSVVMKTNVLLLVYTAMEASTIEFLSVRLFANFSKTPVCEHTDHNVEETDAEMRDELADSPFIQVDSASHSLSSDHLLSICTLVNITYMIQFITGFNAARGSLLENVGYNPICTQVYIPKCPYASTSCTPFHSPCGKRRGEVRPRM